MMQRMWAIFMHQMYLLRRSPHRIVALFYWPTMELFLWGLLTVYLNQIGGAQFNFVTVLLSALIFWDFFNRAQQSISVSFLEDVWARNVANVLASPIRPAEYLLGLILVSIFQATLSITFISVLAAILWKLQILQFGLYLIPFLGLLFLTGWAIGILSTAIILRLGPSADILAWSLPLLIQPLSAVFYPVSVLPGWVEQIALWIPTVYVFEGMRAVVLEGQLLTEPLLKALGLNILYLVIAGVIFNIAYRSVRKRGVLSRYSD